MTKNKKMMISALPFVALVVLLAVFCGIVSSKGYRLDMYIKIVFNEGIVLSIVATGAIFIYTLGSFDISLGAATLFAATLGVLTYNATENFALMIIVILLAGLLTGQFSACVHISYSGVCYNGSNDVRVIRDCIADYYDKRWCGWWNQYSKRGCKTSG